MGSNFWRRGSDNWGWDLGWEKIMNGRRRWLGKGGEIGKKVLLRIADRPIQPASNQP
jgi:hypothetical protein